MPTIDVLDSAMYYEERGDGAPVVFLHGNPASSRAWRKVLPAIGGSARLLAPDLIGMGRSGKPDIPYAFEDHARYLDAWFDALGLDDAVIVGHDWGGALGFDHAARHPGRVRGVAFFETIVRTMSSADLGEAPRRRYEMLQSPEGETRVLDSDFLITTAFTGGVLNPLPEDEIAAYLTPYETRESRRPLLTWARSSPIDGRPAAVSARIEAYDAWLTSSPEVPKLLLTFDSSPTLLITPAMAGWCAANVASLEIEHLGAAGHHAAEDRPGDIAAAITAWAARHGLT